MLNDEQIRNFFEDTDLPLVDVVSKDRLPDKKYIGDYVINMEDDDAGNGTHWVFCKITEGKGLYFDSFGVYPPEDVKKFIKPMKIMFSERQIQDLKSDMCGYYCSALAYYLKHDTNPKKSLEDNFYDFLDMFSDNTKKNDKILKEYLTKNSVYNDFKTT
jgi:hypothetical protein